MTAIPTRSEQLINPKEKTWKDDHFFLQAVISENPEVNYKEDYHPGGWNIRVNSDLKTLVLNPKVRDLYPEAKDLPVNKDIQALGDVVDERGKRTSMVSGTAYVSVTTRDNKTPRYFTLRRDAGAPIAAGFLTTASGFAGEHPMNTIVKEANEECGVYYVDRQNYTLKRVAFADVVRTQHHRKHVGAPELFTEVRATYDVGNTLDKKEWKDIVAVQQPIIAREIGIHYPQFSNIDIAKTEPVLANKIDSCLYKQIGLCYDPPHTYNDREFGDFNAFAYYQPEFNVLNLGLVYHVDLPCDDADLIVIDNETFGFETQGREAKLLTTDELSKEEKMLSFFKNYMGQQQELIEKARANNLAVAQPL
jgi:hypothetical protein